jgi:hypothetical protein
MDTGNLRAATVPDSPAQPRARVRVLRSSPRRHLTLGVDGASRGEPCVARIRLVLTCFLLLFVLPSDPGPLERAIAAGCAILAITLGAFLYALARHCDRLWLGILCSAVDVTLVSAASVIAAALGGERDWTALYVLAVVCASRRQDRRLSIFTGLVAMGQNAIVALAHGVPPGALAYQHVVLIGSTIASAAMAPDASLRARPEGGPDTSPNAGLTTGA